MSIPSADQSGDERGCESPDPQARTAAVVATPLSALQCSEPTKRHKTLSLARAKGKDMQSTQRGSLLPGKASAIPLRKREPGRASTPPCPPAPDREPTKTSRSQAKSSLARLAEPRLGTARSKAVVDKDASKPPPGQLPSSVSEASADKRVSSPPSKEAPTVPLSQRSATAPSSVSRRATTVRPRDTPTALAGVRAPPEKKPLRECPSAKQAATLRTAGLHGTASKHAAKSRLELQRLAQWTETQQRQLQTAHASMQQVLRAFDVMVVLYQHVTTVVAPALRAKADKLQKGLSKAILVQVQLDKCKAAMAATLSDLHERLALQSRHVDQLESELSQLRQSHVHERDALQDAHRQETLVLCTLHRSTLEQRETEQRAHLDDLAQQHDARLRALDDEHRRRMGHLQQQWDDEREHTRHSLEADKRRLEARVDELQRELDQQRGEKQVRRETRLSSSHLEMELDSLKAVVELRNREIQELRTRNNVRQQRIEQLEPLQERVSTLERRNEDLKEMLSLKCQSERDMTEKNVLLLRRFDRESQEKRRLSLENEQLKWRLSQNDLTAFSDSPSPQRGFRSGSSCSMPSPTVDRGSPRFARKSPQRRLRVGVSSSSNEGAGGGQSDEDESLSSSGDASHLDPTDETCPLPPTLPLHQ